MLWFRLAVLLGVVTWVSACSSSGGDDDNVLDSGSSVVLPDASTDVQDTCLGNADVVWESLPTLPCNKEFHASWAAGTSRRVVNPDHVAFLGGFGLCEGNADLCRYSGGTHDDLTVTALALAHVESGEVVVFVAVDSVGLLLPDVQTIHEAVPQAFAEAYGVRMEGPRVIVGSSHSHSTPDTVGLYGPMDKSEREEEAYIAALRQAVVDTSVEAYGRLEDVDLEWATASAPNEDLDSCADDQAIWVIRGTRTEDHSTVFTMTRWVSHPTVYWDYSNAISADYVGTLRRRMEQDGGTALYFNGPIGSVYPVVPPACELSDAFPEGWQDPDVPPEDHAAVNCMGTSIAEAALQALATNPHSLSGPLSFHHQEFSFHPTNVVLMLFMEKEAIPIDPVDVNDPDSRFPSEFSWVQMGDLDLVTTPGEAFPCFASHIAQALQATGRPHTIVLSVTQDWMGYLLAADQWSDPALGYHRTLSPGETVEPAYMEALERLLSSAEE